MPVSCSTIGKMPSRQGFTLVEMAITLTIIGLLIGVVATGQYLIRSAQLRKIPEQFARYESAILQFSDRYRALPGDMRNATDYWSEINFSAGCLSPAVGTSGNAIGVGSGTETCNGNGDDKIANESVGDLYHEAFRFWQHLANAKMIEGMYTGHHGTQDTLDHDIGVNVPIGPLDGTGWGVMYIGDYEGSTTTTNRFFNHFYGNVLVFGTDITASQPMGEALIQQEAWDIDDKFDDGSPATGEITAAVTTDWPASACTTEWGDSADMDAEYHVDEDYRSCALIFQLAPSIRGGM